MLHHCSNHSGGGGGVAARCSCGFIHSSCTGGAFSILFPMAGGDCGGMSPSSSAVDCTLSLGTPATRHVEKTTPSPKAAIHHTSCVPSFCWDILSKSSTKHINGGASGTPASNSSSNLAGDPLLLARRCANCDTTSTPLWRNGPRGPKSLCNACGIRYKKEERRAAATTAAAEQVTGCEGYRRHAAAQQPWGCYTSAKGGGAAISMSFAAGDGVDHRREEEDNTTADVSYLSWRLDAVPSSQFPVRDRRSLFQYQ